MDDAGGKFPHILDHLQDLQVRDPPRGYFPEPTKRILVVDLRNVSQAEDLFQGMGLKIVMGSRYLGGFIRDGETEKRWLAGKVEGWEESVRTLAWVYRKHLQSAYAGLHKSLHQE